MRLFNFVSSGQPWRYLDTTMDLSLKTTRKTRQSSASTNLSKLAEYLDAEQLPSNELRWFKLAIEDVKAYYLEALTAQPGHHDQNKVYARMWHETQLGAGLLQFYKGFSSHPRLNPFARIVLPRAAVENDSSKRELSP
jgi:hypothetical protein